MNEVMSFAEAVREFVIDIYDNECQEVFDKATKDQLTELEFEETASAVIRQFMEVLYTFDRPKFQEIIKPIKAEYERLKMLQDADWARAKLTLVQNEDHLSSREEV